MLRARPNRRPEIPIYIALAPHSHYDEVRWRIVGLQGSGKRSWSLTVALLKKAPTAFITQNPLMSSSEVGFPRLAVVGAPWCLFLRCAAGNVTSLFVAAFNRKCSDCPSLRKEESRCPMDELPGSQ